jgi:D-alanyl-D-alanine carboxypeptidase
MRTSPIPRRRGRSIRRNLALAAVVAGTLSTGEPGASATGRHEDQARLRRDADAITGLGVTGVQAGLTLPGGRERIATSGVADLATRQPVPANGYFRIASVTKTFVATVILQLAGDGRLSLDDTVERWLPGVVSGNGNDGHAITIRQLLQHTSGIHDDYPDYTSAEDFYQHRYDTYTAEQILGELTQAAAATRRELPEVPARRTARGRHRAGQHGRQRRGRARLHHRRSQPVLPRPARRPAPATGAARADEAHHSGR